MSLYKFVSGNVTVSLTQRQHYPKEYFANVTSQENKYPDNPPPSEESLAV